MFRVNIKKEIYTQNEYKVYVIYNKKHENYRSVFFTILNFDKKNLTEIDLFFHNNRIDNKGDLINQINLIQKQELPSLNNFDFNLFKEILIKEYF